MAWNNMFASLISRSAFWVNFKGRIKHSAQSLIGVAT